MQDFLWHKVSKEEQEKIKKEAKGIMDSFAKALEKVEKEMKEESYVDREVSERVEKTGREFGKDFKKKILENAPQHDDDFIIAEKKGW